jgi:hypothetical protein
MRSSISRPGLERLLCRSPCLGSSVTKPSLSALGHRQYPTAGETPGGVRQTVGEHDKPTIGSRANFFGKQMSTIRAQIDRR